MGKVVDITDKLSFDGNPTLVVKGKKLEVNADAPTVLKVMNFMQKENVNDMEVVSAMYQLIFPEKSRTEIDKLKPSISDWMIIIQEAMALVTGEANSQSRRFCQAPEALDWPEPQAWRDRQLEARHYLTAWHRNALGELLGLSDARGNRQRLEYNVAGEQVRVGLLTAGGKSKLLVDELVYNAAGQVTSERAGNGVVTRATYADDDGSLRRLQASRGGARVASCRI